MLEILQEISIDKMYKVPIIDLYSQHKSIKDEIDLLFNDVIKNSLFIRGKYVEKFEDDFAKLTKNKFCLSCGNGTDSLYIALKSLDVGPGDEVIVPAHSWISTSEVVTQCGANVVFCDINDFDSTIDVLKIEALITNNTVGIIPVHLYGHPADMDGVMSIANKNNLWVVEDCAQSHLAEYKNKLVGSFGSFGSFSFYPGKNMGAMGDAGALVTNDHYLYRKSTMIARHGGLKKGEHKIEGINSRMDGFQAGVLSIKSKYLKEWNNKRYNHSLKYTNNLLHLNNLLTVPNSSSNVKHAWHMYIIKSNFRDELSDWLNKNSIQTSINYPKSLPFLEAYKRLNHKHSDFPVALKHQKSILSLPLYPELNNNQILYVINKINEFFENF